jgi:hypothetical protein
MNPLPTKPTATNPITAIDSPSGKLGGRDISAASVALAKRNVNEIVAPGL